MVTGIEGDVPVSLRGAAALLCEFSLPEETGGNLGRVLFVRGFLAHDLSIFWGQLLGGVHCVLGVIAVRLLWTCWSHSLRLDTALKGGGKSSASCAACGQA